MIFSDHEGYRKCCANALSQTGGAMAEYVVLDFFLTCSMIEKREIRCQDLIEKF